LNVQIIYNATIKTIQKSKQMLFKSKHHPKSRHIWIQSDRDYFSSYQ